MLRRGLHHLLSRYPVVHAATATTAPAKLLLPCRPQLPQSKMMLCSYSTAASVTHIAGRSRGCSFSPLCQQQLQRVSSAFSETTTTARMSTLHIGPVSPTPTARSSRPLLLPCLQAAAGGGAGAGSGGAGGKGFSSGGGSSGSADGGGGGLWESYNRLLQQYPLLVKAVTTAVLSAVGNVICQFAVEGKSELDWRRFNTFTALGLVWVAPCLHFWFGTLNRLVTSPGNVGALMRMGLDQLGFAPLFISSMIAILAGLDGKPLEACVGVVKRDLPDAIRANWALWVPAQFINFRFVPATYQVLFANMVALVWNVYFSFATRPKTA